MAHPPSPGGAPWRIIPRPLLETILNNHAHHHRVPQPLLLHGPRGVGKSSLLIHRLLPSWNSGPHLTAFIDFNQSHPSTWTPPPPSPFPPLRSLLESSLETLTLTAIRLGAVSSRNIYKVLSKYHSLRSLQPPSRAVTEARAWQKAVYARAGEMVVGEGEFEREARAAMEVAREVIGREREWRRNAVRWMNSKEGRFSRSLVNSATDWPMLLVEVLSEAAEVDFFQV